MKPTTTPTMNSTLTVALLSGTDDMRPMALAWKAVHPEHDLRLIDDLGNPNEIDVAVCWFPPQGVLAKLPRLRLVQSVGAGIEHLLADSNLPRHLPTFRIVDPKMAAGMAAYVAWAVINGQRDLDYYAKAQRSSYWAQAQVSAPHTHGVGILGLGELGLQCARSLSTLGYRVAGWSRTPKADLPDEVAAFVASTQLAEFLSHCDTLICLLPLTDETRGLLNAALFAQLPIGAHLINVGRGDHLVESDLLKALASGQLSQATLDTFSVEPLPTDHLFWQHPQIRITPHIATRTAVEVIASQMLENLAGLPAETASPRRVQWARGY
jgi:glyoxylate/hydroxypyruvate reductase A